MLTYVYNNSKGFILTAEALLSLVILLSLIPIIHLLSSPITDSVYEFVILSDVYEVMEKKYHQDVANFVEKGEVSKELESYFEYLYTITGLKIYISFRDRRVPSQYSNCDKKMIVNRLFMSNFWHELHIGTCDNN